MPDRNERAYGFRADLNAVHKPGRRDPAARRRRNELEITGDWRIVADRKAAPLTANAALDLQDYFLISQGLSLRVERTPDIMRYRPPPRTIVLAGRPPGPRQNRSRGPGGYTVEVGDDGVVVRGCDARALAQGVFYLEDLMNLRQAPFLPMGVERRAPLFDVRMVHSGWGLDQYPDPHLRALAHLGFTAVVVFVRDVDMTAHGYLDFNDLIERAAAWGLDVYFYSYLKSLKHPREKDAHDYYASSYGRLFAACPGAKGVVLVGESCEFPSRDPHTTGRLRRDMPDDGIRPSKPSPGWWPCADYPEWLAMLKKVIRPHNPAADIVFWTYNWGYAPAADRLRLVRKLPRDVSLQVTFEMFDRRRRHGTVTSAADYTIAYPGPGRYFTSEARAAHRRGLRLYTMSNSAGLTWDFGVVPYVPVPFRWLTRFRALRRSRANWGLIGLMESHHFGVYPSEISELAKWCFWTPEVDPVGLLRRMARRDYGAAAGHVMRAWRAWSRAMDDYVVTTEDQYGPCRVGPAYPLIFHPDITRTFAAKEITMPAAPWAHFGGKIVKTFYHPYEYPGHSPAALRYPVEIRAFTSMRRRWEAGLRALDAGAGLVPEDKRRGYEKLRALGLFIRNTLTTVIHVKQWWLLNTRLMATPGRAAALRLMEQLEKLARAEAANARATIPVVQTHSRLGWEPSMEYMTDRGHLEWKIRQVRNVLEYEMPCYRRVLRSR